jgi:outer membrane protein assembly factor BamE (lipoprotein component of BamABCDE complex)
MAKNMLQVFALMAILGNMSACEEPKMMFDQTAWKSGSGNYSGSNPRGVMVSAAKDAGVKVGAARSEILTLLGDPDKAMPAYDIWYLGKNDMAPDYQSLRLEYDSNGTVSKISVVNS